MRTKVYALGGANANPQLLAAVTGQASSSNTAVAASQLPAIGQPLTLVATNVYIAAGQHLVSGTGMTLAHSGIPVWPSPLTLTSTGNASAVSLAVVGVGVSGEAITETMAGPNANTVFSVNVYASITSITPNANFSAQNVSAGFITYFAPAQNITLTSASNLSTLNFTINGTSQTGAAQSEVIAGPNADTVTSAKKYQTVTSITHTAFSSNDVSVGYAAYNSVTAGSNLLLAPYVFGSQQVLSISAPYSGVAPGIPMEVTITPASGALANTYTVTGRDRWGINVISEVITTDTAGDTAQSTKVYSEVFSVVPSVSDTAGVGVGVPNRVTTPYVQLNQTRGLDQAEIADVSVDTVVGSPVYTLEGTAESINSFGVGTNGLVNVPTYTGDNAPIDYSHAESTFPVEIPQGLQWARLVNTGGAGSSAITRWVRPSF